MKWYSIFTRAAVSREDWKCNFDGKLAEHEARRRCYQLSKIPADVRLFAGKEVGKLILELKGAL